MTLPNEDQAYRDIAVPVGAVSASGSTRGRLAAIAIGAVIVVAIVMAVVSRANPATREPSSSTLARLPESSAGSADPGYSGGPTSTPAAAPPEQHLPVLGNTPLTDAPRPYFYRRKGDDLEILGWLAGGRRLQPVRTLSGAFKGLPESEVLSISTSPDARFAFIRSIDAYSNGHPDVARVASDGRVAWQRRDVTGRVDPLWSGDGQAIVIPRTRDEWLLVRLSGSSSDVRALDVAGIAPPGPPPNLEYLASPVATSADGRWVYGESVANADRANRAIFRVRTAGGKASRISAFPSEGGTRAVADRFDPLTGRTVDPTGFPNGDGTTLDVRDNDGTMAFRQTFPSILGTAWIGDGRLAVLEADRAQAFQSLALVTIDVDGDVGAPLLESGPLTGAGLFAARDGYLFLGLATAYPIDDVLIVLLRASDGATETLHLSSSEIDGLQIGGWLQ